MPTVTDPYTGETVCEVPLDDDAALEAKVEGAARAFSAWREVPVAERARAVLEALAWFEEHEERVALEVTRQMGKPITQARAEVAGMLERARYMCEIAAATLAPDVLPPEPGFTRRIEHVPLGVVLDIAAWNYPLLIAVNVVVPALLAGNACLLKHSARTPLCGRQFAEALGGLAPGLVQDVVLTHDRTEALVGDPRIAHVAFTGSVTGGRAVHAAAAGTFKEVGLELGGKDPAYVAADADLERAATGVVEGACYNAGQSCCAVERVYVHRDVHDEFVDRALAELENFRPGDPKDPATTLGPLADARALGFLEAQVEDAIGRGARVLAGGRRVDARFFPATLLVGCPQDAPILQEESFGPLVPIARVEDDEDALRCMNDSRYGLTASIWTTDAERAERLAARLETGTVYRNRCDVLDPALPWVGVKDSGRGVTLSRYGLLVLTRRKAIHFRD